MGGQKNLTIFTDDRIRGSPVKDLGRTTGLWGAWRRGREYVLGIELDRDLEPGVLVASSAACELSDHVSVWPSLDLRFFLYRVTGLYQMTSDVSSSTKIHDLKREQKHLPLEVSTEGTLSSKDSTLFYHNDWKHPVCWPQSALEGFVCVASSTVMPLWSRSAEVSRTVRLRDPSPVLGSASHTQTSWVRKFEDKQCFCNKAFWEFFICTNETLLCWGIHNNRKKELFFFKS